MGDIFGGTTINLGLAKKYLLKAVELGYIYRYKDIAHHYFNGSNLFEKNQTQAFIYYKKAADLGDVYSCAAISYMYEKGIGCHMNIDEAKKYHDMTKAKEEIKTNK